MDICKDSEFCGGCAYMGVPYEEQLLIKQNLVLSLLEERKINVKKVEEIEPTPSVHAYRNKMEYTFGDLSKDGPMTLGMHQKGKFMSIVTVDDCRLVHDDFNIILANTLKFCSRYSKYHKRSHEGLMRNLIIRRGVRTNELLINIVTARDTADESFDEEGFVRMICALTLKNEAVGILRTLNDNLADAVNCEELKVLWGRDYYNEKMMGLSFKVSAFSFFQTNVEAAEKMYSYAIDLIDDFEDKTVFDLFCGTGTITQTLAQKAEKVVGIELVGETVDAARENAGLNGLANCEFIQGDVFEVLETLSGRPDVIVLDPPRVGIHEKALEKIIGYGVNQIVYISCSPKTLIENLRYLEYYGYEVTSLKCFDNFAMTKHIETVALLTKKG